MNELQHPRASGTFMPPLSSQSIRERARSRGEPSWLIEARSEALERYLKLEAPRWRRTDLADLDVAARATAAWSRDHTLSLPRPAKAEGVVHMPLAQAAREHEELVRGLMRVSPRADKWETLVNALWTGGSLLFVEKGKELTEPISIESAYTPDGALTRDLIVLGAASKASIVQRALGASKGAFVGGTLDVDVRDGASLALATMQDLAHGATLLANRHANLHRDATLAWIDGQFGAGTSVTVNETNLLGPGGNLRFLGAFFGSHGQHMDVTTSALHEAPHTQSQLDMKGALNEDGYSANYSIVNIGPLAKNSSGHQKQETLLLSEKARADAIPKLDVENNDVSASHGATVGQVDPEQMFYLRSRGFTELGAKRMIVEGFFDPLLREIPVDAIRDEITANILGRLKG